MTRRIVDEPAYVLHVRAYRETSAIIDLLTLQHGRVSVVARGVRRARGGQPHPFGRLSVGCSGRGQLLTLAGYDSISHRWLTGDALYAGLYLNELLLRLLRDDDPHPVCSKVTNARWTVCSTETPRRYCGCSNGFC